MCSPAAGGASLRLRLGYQRLNQNLTAEADSWQVRLICCWPCELLATCGGLSVFRRIMTVRDWRLRLGRVPRAEEAASFFQSTHLDMVTAAELHTATRGAVSLSRAEYASTQRGFGCGAHPACLVHRILQIQQVQLRGAFNELYYDAAKAEDRQTDSRNNDW